MSKGQYFEFYNGKSYLIYYKYSSMINTVYVTFMYGMGIPSLFMAALLIFIIMYIQEKLLLAYVNQKPPLFDKKLGNLSLKMISFAPVLYYMFGYWMTSNPEMFYNDVSLNPFA